MAKKEVEERDPNEVMTHFNALSVHKRNTLFSAHEPAYQLNKLIGAGLVDGSALTGEGKAALDAFAKEVGVGAEQKDGASKPTGK